MYKYKILIAVGTSNILWNTSKIIANQNLFFSNISDSV